VGYEILFLMVVVAFVVWKAKKKPDTATPGPASRNGPHPREAQLYVWTESVGMVVERQSGARSCGRIGEFDVELVYDEKVGNSSSGQTSLSVKCDFPADLTIGVEVPGLSAWVGNLLSGDDIRTGDVAFDRTVRLRGPVAEALARMTEPARNAVRNAVAAQVDVKAGRVRWSTTNQADDLGNLTLALKHALMVAHLTQLDEPVEARLARNAREEALPDVRHANLRALATTFPDAAETRAALELGLRDPAPEVRVLAADLAGGPAAEAALEPLVDGSVAALNALRATAAAVLGRVAPGSAVLAAQQDWLLGRLAQPAEIAVPSIQALGAFAGLGLVEALLPYAGGASKQKGVRDAAAEAIKAIQNRAGGVAGALSVVDTRPGTGALSHVAPERARNKAHASEDA
jgi:hypothetical protein